MSAPAHRILYVITDLEVGGVPLHLYRLASAMRQRAWHVQVVCLAPAGPVARKLQDAGVAVTSCQATSRCRPGALLQLRKEMAAFRPAVVHALLFHANLASRLVAPLARLSPRRLICEIQTVEIERPWHLRLDRWTHRLCALEIGNSPSVIAHLRHAGGLPPAKLQLIEGSVDYERFANATPISRERLGIPESSALVLWVGRLDPVKGLDHLLDAFSEVSRRKSAYLLLVGAGAERVRIAARIRALRLQDRAILAGVRDDIPQLLKACDLFALPSYTEGMPNALLEAMAAGCPIVCSEIPAHRRLITHRRSGLLVPPGDARSLASAMLDLLDDSALARESGQRAQSAAAAFRTNTMISKYIQCYDAIIAQSTQYRKDTSKPPPSCC